MREPSYQLRQQVAERSRALRGSTDEEAENGLSELLSAICEHVQSEIDEHSLDQDEINGQDLISSCHEWASLASYAVAQVYAPNSPFPRNVAGWGSKAIARLNQLSAMLRKPLDLAKHTVGANSYSISVGFPWGISIGLSWS